MAKLSARNRKTVVECVREYDEQSLLDMATKHGFVGADSKALTRWERCTRRLMSDGTILEKRDVQFQPDWLDKEGRKHSYGWKVHGKLKTGLTPEDFARIYRADRKSGAPSPWTVTDSGPLKTPKLISQTRLMRAVQSGEFVGFCTECGSEQHGVEPDANGYRCERCGAMAVCGAEDLLAGLA